MTIGRGGDGETDRYTRACPITHTHTEMQDQIRQGHAKANA